MTHPRPGSLASRLGADESTVLVVEDEPDIASFLGAFFRASGTEVVHLDPASAEEVVERAASLHVACALVDLNLSGFTGFDVIEALAADERVAHIPVIIVTADARPATQQRAAAVGAVGFVPKPFNVKDVFTTVQALVEQHRLRPARPRAASSRPAHGAPPAIPEGVDPAPPQVDAPLLAAEAVTGRLASALAASRRAKTATTFALVRLAGPAASPAVVGEVARRLGAALDDAEVLGATAADELAVLFSAGSPEAAASALLDAVGGGRLMLDLGPGRAVAVDVRVGIASSPAHATTGDELYMAADLALADALDADEPLVTAR